MQILGIPVNSLTMEQAVEAVCRAGEEGRVLHVVTANAEILYRCRRDQELAGILAAADLVTADGFGVVLASRLVGRVLPERVAGFDLMMACLGEAARRRLAVYFLGAHPRVLAAAVARAKETFPGLKVVGGHHGYFAEAEEEKILEEICLLKPALLLVAMGVPKQEKWIFRYKEKLPPCAAIGLGGSFDVLAGKTRRAPLWMQRAGLEWLYRCLKEPSRLGRVAVLPLFLFAVLGQAFQNCFNRFFSRHRLFCKK